ncbi:MAG: hypothetical protein WC505_07070 [Patescibacteria group bacterium]
MVTKYVEEDLGEFVSQSRLDLDAVIQHLMELRKNILEAGFSDVWLEYDPDDICGECGRSNLHVRASRPETPAEREKREQREAAALARDAREKKAKAKKLIARVRSLGFSNEEVLAQFKK